MITTIDKFFGESALSKQPEKKLHLVITDGAITTEKIKDQVITPNKLSDDVYRLIRSIETNGVALAGELGNSELIGIHQKKLTELFNELYGKIDEINSRGSLIFMGQSLELDEITMELFLNATGNDLSLIGNSMFYVDLDTMELVFNGDMENGTMGVDNEGMLYIMN